jgi:hypothetical protein
VIFEYGIYSKTTRGLLRKGTVTSNVDGLVCKGDFDPPLGLADDEMLFFLHDGKLSSWMPYPEAPWPMVADRLPFTVATK